MVKDVLADRLSFLSATTTQGTCSYGSAAQTVTCSVGSMSVGGVATITIRTKANGKGTIYNTGTISSSTSDPSSGNNSSTVSVRPK
jgi:hypothetical protein